MEYTLFSESLPVQGVFMPRPRKCRKVCCLPKNILFGPVASMEMKCPPERLAEASPEEVPEPSVVLQVDEYETIRLIDLEGMTQEECAEKMHIARTTVQAIYTSARKKLADLLVNSKRLLIAGGDYQLCQGGSVCGGKCAHRLRRHGMNVSCPRDGE